ncbi:MAG: Xaa-Pro peptidase family protein [Paracoccaceae bacterium]|nr:Xaa-Pro peptidase family protein [Paracoccaceae bacterium]
MHTSARKKVAKLQAQMTAKDLDVVVCRLPENIVVLTGFHNVMGWAAVFVPREGDPILITPTHEIGYARNDGYEGDIRKVYVFDVDNPEPPPVQVNMRIAEIAAGLNYKVRRVGYEGSFEVVSPSQLAAWSIVPANPSLDGLRIAFPDAEMVDATQQILAVRVHKDDHDIARFKVVGEIAAFGYERLREICLEHPTEAEATGAMQEVVTAKGIGYKGARFAMIWPQVATGTKSAIWFYYHPSAQRRIKEGDVVLSESACCVDGYYLDLTRTFVVGKPTERQREIWGLTKTALDAAIAKVRPGVLAIEVDEAARDVLRDYKAQFPHHTGHGLGWKYHEPTPLVAPGSPHVLEKGMMIALEPAVYIPDYAGFRNEHNVIVTDDGCIVLDDASPVRI